MEIAYRNDSRQSFMQLYHHLPHPEKWMRKRRYKNNLQSIN